MKWATEYLTHDDMSKFRIEFFCRLDVASFNLVYNNITEIVGSLVMIIYVVASLQLFLLIIRRQYVTYIAGQIVVTRLHIILKNLGPGKNIPNTMLRLRI